MSLLTPLDLNQDNIGTYTRTALLIRTGIPSASGVTTQKITREDSQGQNIIANFTG